MSPFTRAIAGIVSLGLAVWAGPAFAEAAAPAAKAAAKPAVAAGHAAPVAEKPSAATTASSPKAEKKVASSAKTGSSKAKAAGKSSHHVVALGPKGFDADGHPGRVHTVVEGDTLWDISDAYLGTPWVWPSIWSDNPSVANPHLIYPGDQLWITAHEIRKVTPEEAKALLAGSPGSEPASMGEVAYDAAPADSAPKKPPMYRFSARDSVGLVSQKVLSGSASVVGNATSDRVWAGSMDMLNIGLGKGEVEPGDQLVVFRTGERVYDPSSGRALGWNVRMLGWVEVKEVHKDVSTAEVRMAYSEIRAGDRVLPREKMPLEVELRPAKPGIEAQVAHMPADRFQASGNDVVFLDRGTDAGIEVGNVLEIYRPQPKRREPVKRRRVTVPPRVVGALVVVSAFPESSAAIIDHAYTEIQVGDRVRTHPEEQTQ